MFVYLSGQISVINISSFIHTQYINEQLKFSERRGRPLHSPNLNCSVNSIKKATLHLNKFSKNVIELLHVRFMTEIERVLSGGLPKIVVDRNWFSSRNCFSFNVAIQSNYFSKTPEKIYPCNTGPKFPFSSENDCRHSIVALVERWKGY